MGDLIIGTYSSCCWHFLQIFIHHNNGSTTTTKNIIANSVKQITWVIYDMWPCISITESKSRPNIVSVLIGYRFLERICSLFRLYTCELQKSLPKYRIMWPMPSYLFLEFRNSFSNSSLGSEKLKQNRHSLINSRLTDLNSLIRKPTLSFFITHPDSYSARPAGPGGVRGRQTIFGAFWAEKCFWWEQF